MTTQNISEALAGHRNSLGVLRLVLASAVIFDHAFPLGGFGTSPFRALTGGQTDLGSFAVIGFFAISGYLIAKSGMTTDILQFLWRRFLRIFPAFWVVLLVAAVIVGPLVWLAMGRSLGDYFTLAGNGPVGYLVKNWTLSIGTWGIYDVFADTTPYGLTTGGSVFNGSLWTLAYEWACYLLIGVFVLFGLLRRARFLVVLVTLLFAVVQGIMILDPSLIAALPSVFADGYRVNLTLTFLVGSCIALYAHRVPYHDGLGVLSGVVVLLTLIFGGFPLIGVTAAAYLFLYLGARLPRAVQWIGAKNDYSYGVYIYGFLVQQIFAFLGVHLWGYVPYVVLALIGAAGLAWLSWHLVEKRAMALKDLGPGRGLRHWGDRMTAFVTRGRGDREASEPPADTLDDSPR